MPRIDTRKRILDVSEHLFSVVGYRHTTTKMIAEMAQVNEVTIFRHFSSKEGIVQGIVARRSAGMQEIAQILNNRTPSDLYTNLLAVAQIQYTYTMANLKLLMILIQEHAGGDVAQFASQLPRSVKDLISAYFQQMQSSGVMKSGDTEQLAVEFLVPTFGFAFMKGLLGDSVTELTPDTFFHTMVSNFVHIYGT